MGRLRAGFRPSCSAFLGANLAGGPRFDSETLHHSGAYSARSAGGVAAGGRCFAGGLDAFNESGSRFAGYGGHCAAAVNPSVPGLRAFPYRQAAIKCAVLGCFVRGFDRDMMPIEHIIFDNVGGKSAPLFRHCWSGVGWQ